MIELIYPNNNENIDLVTDNVKKFYDAYKNQQKLVKNDYKLNGVNWNFDDLIDVAIYINRKNKYIYQAVNFKFKISNKSILFLSLDKKFRKIVFSYMIDKNNIRIYNLLRNKQYFWKIKDLTTSQESETRSFITSDYPRGIKVGKMFNIRDFGGYNTKHNRRIKQNILFRGPEPTLNAYKVFNKVDEGVQTNVHFKTISKDGIKYFQKLIPNGVEIDLREKNEANCITESVFNSKYNRISYLRYDFGSTCYDYIFDLNDESKEWYRKVFNNLANADKRPIYIHCWGGGDRTGTICFLLGALLGMSYTDLVVEYELTSFFGNIRRHYDLNPPCDWLRFVNFIERIEQYAKENSLFSNEIDEIIEYFLINYIKISSETISKIKNAFLE